MLCSVSGELGLRKFLEESGCQFVVTSYKDGVNSIFEKELVNADVVISKAPIDSHSNVGSMTVKKPNQLVLQLLLPDSKKICTFAVIQVVNPEPKKSLSSVHIALFNANAAAAIGQS